MRGKFITFEGPDGSGKTTQVRRLTAYLQDAGFTTAATREPGGTEVAEKIRGILLDPLNRQMTDRTEALLYAASRSQHVEELIQPALADGKIVICDRFTDSTIAYQGFGRKQDLEFLAQVNEIATRGLKPDLTLLLDISPEAGMGRIFASRGTKGDRLEQQSLDFHSRVRQGFRFLAEKDPGRIKLISGEKPADEVFREIKGYVDELLSIQD